MHIFLEVSKTLQRYGLCMFEALQYNFNTNYDASY